MVTIYDVAKKAGVSVATVSRVMNGNSRVGSELRRKVDVAIAELGYKPNRQAQDLRRQTSRLWALIVSDVSNPFFTSLARGVEDVAQAHGLSLVLCNSDENLEREKQYLANAAVEHMAGVIISPISDSGTRLGDLVEHGIPVVAIDRLPRDKAIDSVRSDGYEAARCAVDHLVSAGYTTIAFIGGPLGATSGRERLDGYRRAVADGGLSADENRIWTGDYKIESGRAGMRHLLGLAPRPDAVVVGNQLMAVGALEVLQAAGVTMPREIGFIMFDDAPWATLTVPALTVISQQEYELGRQAASLLYSRASQPDLHVRTLILSTELIARGSTARGR